MIAVKKLLVVIDPEQDTQLALDKALKIARFTGTELELLICDYNSYLQDGFYFDPPQAKQLRQEHVQKNLQLLEGMADVIRSQGFTVSVDALWGNPPWQQIIDKVNRSKPDLLVLTTRHHEKIARLLLSHQDWQLLRYCPCPLLLVKDQQWHNPPVFVVAVDPAHVNDKPATLDRQLLTSANWLASVAEGELHVFHSYYKPPVSGMYPLAMDETFFHDKVTELLQDVSVPPDHVHMSAQEVQTSLPQLMNDIGADVLVMGAISRSRLDQLFIGNTAEKLLDKLVQDVLIIKPAGFNNRGFRD